MKTLKWFVCLSMCLSCGYSFMFSSLRAKEAPGKVPCGGHFRTRHNPSDHGQSWLVNKWLWILFVISLYVMLKIRGDGEKSLEQLTPSIQACSLHPTRKAGSPSLQNDYAFNTLTKLEMDLIKFVSKVRNLKQVMAMGKHLRHHGPERHLDPNDNITIYEVWGEEDE
ncbi:protein FAM209-like [Suncus etruscus]|uniref:protein FAM209-like n=1 Tax=Suncus etruscus TaxID=109475 RepID=UPI002110500D|nr:protein FAM209-like [Suncus etruscus]